MPNGQNHSNTKRLKIIIHSSVLYTSISVRNTFKHPNNSMDTKNIQFYVTLAYKATHLLPKKYVKMIVLKLH